MLKNIISINKIIIIYLIVMNVNYKNYDNDNYTSDSSDDESYPFDIINKIDINIKKINPKSYSTYFVLLNNKILIPRIFDFCIINIMKDINKDIIDDVFIIDTDSDNEKLIIVIFKHLFKDLNIDQQYICSKVKKTIVDNKVVFELHTNELISNYSHYIKDNLFIKKAKQINIVKFIFTTIFENDHNSKSEIKIEFKEKNSIPKYFEKLLSKIISKLFLQTKQFIENMII
jgi:hypothetical protein